MKCNFCIFIFGGVYEKTHFSLFFGLNGLPYLGPFFYCFYFLDCSVDLNIISNEDTARLRSGKIHKNECDSLSIKMALGMINFCVNMSNIREGATESALKFILSKVEKCKPNSILCRDSTFTEVECSADDDDDDNEIMGTMIQNQVCDPKITAVDNEITSGVVCGANFDLDMFVAEDDDLPNCGPVDLSDVLNAFCYENDGLNE